MTSERKNAYTRDELLMSGRGVLFGPDFGRLPAPPLLMFDRIPSISADGEKAHHGQITAEMDIDPNSWFFACHFIDDPVMPGCLGLDAMWQLVGFWLGWAGMPGKGRALGVGNVRFSGEVTQDKNLIRYEVTIKRVMRGRLPLAIADGNMFVDDEKIYQARDLKVGVFGV